MLGANPNGMSKHAVIGDMEQMELSNGQTPIQKAKNDESTKPNSSAAYINGIRRLSKLLEQYGCGPVQFTGTNDALYERHLVFDNVMEATTIGARERFEAIARSVRDILSQRWV